MLRYIEVRNASDALVTTLPVQDPNNAQSIWVKDIQGLGPVTASLASSKYANGLGGEIQRASLGSRNLVLTLGLTNNYADPSTTISSIRKSTYGYFSPRTVVKLRLVDGPSINDWYDFVGVVESSEPTIFTQTPDLVVSIVSTDPFFSAVTSSAFANSTEAVIPGPANMFGSGDSGFEIEVTVNGIREYVSISNGTHPDIVIFPTDGMVSGDTLFVSTIFGRKNISLLRSGETIPVKGFHMMSSGSLDMTLKSSDPHFSVVTGFSGDAYTLSFTKKFVGI